MPSPGVLRNDRQIVRARLGGTPLSVIGRDSLVSDRFEAGPARRRRAHHEVDTLETDP